MLYLLINISIHTKRGYFFYVYQSLTVLQILFFCDKNWYVFHSLVSTVSFYILIPSF